MTRITGLKSSSYRGFPGRMLADMGWAIGDILEDEDPSLGEKPMRIKIFSVEGSMFCCEWPAGSGRIGLVSLNCRNWRKVS